MELKRRSWLFLIWLPLIAFLGCGIVWPLWDLFRLPFMENGHYVSGIKNFEVFFSTPGLLKATVHSIVCATVAATISSMLAFVLGFSICCANIPGKKVLHALYMSPLFAPAMMPAIGLIYLFGAKGILFPADIYGYPGVITGFVVMVLPACTMQIEAALENLDAAALAAAKSLGAGAWRRFLTVTLPHAKNALLRCWSLAFVFAITDFGVPAVLGGKFSLLATEVYKQAVGLQDFKMGAIASLLLLGISTSVFFLDRHRSTSSAGFGNSHEKYVPPASRARDFFCSVAAWLIVGIIVVILGSVVYGSFIMFWPYNRTLALNNFDFTQNLYGWSPFGVSLLLAAAVSVAGTCLTFLGAYLSLRVPGSRSWALVYRGLAFLPMCIPGTVLGLAWIISFGSWSLFSGFLGGMLLLIVNTVVHLYSIPHFTNLNKLDQIDLKLEDASRTLGAGRLRVIRKVIFPLSRSTVAECASYFFVTTLGSISAVIFLYRPDTITASITALQLIDCGKISQGAAIVTVIMAMALLGRVAILYLVHRAGRGAREERP